MKLREWMTRRDLSVGQVSQMLDCSESIVHRWISGEILPSLELMARIMSATSNQVTVGDFVEPPPTKPPPPRRRVGRPSSRDARIEAFLRARGLKAIGILVAQIPECPVSRPTLQRYLSRQRLPRWRVRAGGKPSIWLGACALDVSDSYRIVQALRGRPPVVQITVEEVRDDDA